MAEKRPRNTWHYRPGEMVVAIELPPDPADHRQAHSNVRQAIQQRLAGSVGGVFQHVQRRTDPIVFRAPGRPPLGFLFYDLAEPQHDFVKQVVSASYQDSMAALEPLRGTGLSPVGIMPHWLGSAQSNYSDGSPASLPGPARPPSGGRWRYRYTAQEAGLDFRSKVEGSRVRTQVPVVILDTRPDWVRAKRQAARFADQNGQLAELLDFFEDTNLAEWHTAALDERDKEALKLARAPDGRTRAHDMSDHALFIAGLIHDLSPRTQLHVQPVLNRYGVGDLHLLLQVLHEVTVRKAVSEPRVINMSLGFLPRLEHLPWVWYGVSPPNNPEFVADAPIRGAQHDRAWMASHRDEVGNTTRALQAALDRLARYLLANNCLGVPAAGNDSLRRVESGRPRLGPRIPARYESVLGVAATRQDPSNAAPYSNIGDELEFGDHIATFGGDVTDQDEPLDGVIGVFTAPTFPTARRGAPAAPNEAGFAMWSGTSFATAIASGLVAGYWSLARTKRPQVHAEEVLAGFDTLAGSYAPALRTPSIGMRGEWLAT